MIACLGKNKRGAPLFDALKELDSRYTDLGAVQPSRNAHLAGLLRSVTSSLAETKREARFSPPFLAGAASACAERLAGVSEPIEAVLYWGATNVPVPARDTSPPYAVVTDGPFDPDDPDYPVEWRPRRWSREYQATQREVFDRAVHVFTLSEWARKKVIAVHRQPPEKVTKCGWGPLACLFPPRLEPVGGTRLVVSVGSDWRRKGMDLVAGAGARLHAADPSVMTVIAGVPGDLDLGPTPGVSFLPVNTPIPVVHALMRAASCLVVAARFDASPHVIYEALQYGTPVVGTDVCGIPEAIEAPLGGLVAAPNAGAVHDALKSVLEQDGQPLRQSAYETFLRSGSWRRSAEIVRSKLP